MQMQVAPRELSVPLDLRTHNVLHALHGQNWDAFPMCNPRYDEEERLAGTVSDIRAVVEAHSEGVLVYALQEVSGALLGRLTALAADYEGICAQVKCPRATRLREGKMRVGYNLRVAEGDGSGDEYEVLLVFAKDAKSRPFFAQTLVGNAAVVAVYLAEAALWVATTHLAYGARGDAQLDEVRALLVGRTTADVGAVLLGDFNCTAEHVRRRLRREIEGVRRFTTVSVIEAPAPTRNGTASVGTTMLTSAEKIDHVVLLDCPASWHARVARVYAIDVFARSDHCPFQVLLAS